MHFEIDKVYHIYNRSNETVFYNDRNYIFFLTKVTELIKPVADIIAWCLMPNHFHFLIVANDISCDFVKEKHRPNVQILSKNIGTLLSSYTKGLNKEINRRGKLFSHNTKAKCLNDAKGKGSYALSCFHYIHQNPMNANLCKSLEDWPYSSFLEFAGSRNGSLVNKGLAEEIVNFDDDNFMNQTLAVLNEKNLKMIW